MRVEILGCSGGIGDGRQTTAILIDDDILIDAGSGTLSLSTEQMLAINHLFITHSHLDHILGLPLILDSVGSERDTALIAHAPEAVLTTLHCNIFNWFIWPDFCRIPNAKDPYLKLENLEAGQICKLSKGRYVRAIPANHTIPAVGYEIGCSHGSIVFSGDTTFCTGFWHAVAKVKQLKYLIIETAFSDEEKMIAELSKHLSPAMLMEMLNSYHGDAEIFITHLKPGQEDKIMKQIQERSETQSRYRPKRLMQGQVFEI